MPKLPEVGGRSWGSVHLNAIRGAAALVVLLGHTRGLFFTTLTAYSQSGQTSNFIAQRNRATVGEEAVIIFFVLSGYLVGGSVLRSIRNGTWSWKNYLFKRITRLWVVLIPALICGVFLDNVGMHFLGSESSIYAGPSLSVVPHDLAARLSWKVIAANAVFLQGILSPTAGTNNSLWSLAYEWWYYLQFPLLILAFAKATKPLLRVAYLALLIGSTLFVGKDILILFPTWLLGALIAALPLRTLSRWLVAPILTVSVSCLLLIKRFDLSKQSAAWCVAVAFSLVLFCAVRHKGICGNAIYQRVAGFFSDISYTLYLVHLPLAIFICACIDRPWHYYSLSFSNAIMFLFINAGIIVAAYIFYGLFEGNTDRIRRLFDNRVPEPGIVNFSVEKSEAQARFG